MEDWYLQRQGHPGSKHHLNILLGNKEKLTIGRKAGGVVDIVCNGKTVSREHCILKYVDSCWQVEDLESMNGVYVNRKRIQPRTPTSLAVGDVLGVGAVDTSERDYHVFDVCKTVIKDENENLNEGVLLVPPVNVGHNVEIQLNKMSNNNIPALQEELCNQVKQEKTSDDHQDPGNGDNSKDQGKDVQTRGSDTVSTVEESVKFTDPKLNLKCVVVINKLHKSKIRNAQTTRTNFKAKTVPVHGKKRVHRLIDSDDDEDVSLDLLSQKEVPANSSCSPVCWIPMEALKEKNSNNKTGSVEKNKELHSKDIEDVSPHSTSKSNESKGKALKKRPSQVNGGFSENEKAQDGNLSSGMDDIVASTSNSQPRPPCSFVFQKIENRVVIQEQISSIESLSTPTPVNKLARPLFETIDDNSNDCVSFQLTQNPTWEDDDDVIVLSSDEEIFSIPRFKEEPPDNISKRATVDVSKQTVPKDVQEELFADCQTEHVSNTSDEDDLPFFPELSQGILAEIAAEEEEESEEERVVPSTTESEGNSSKKASTGGDKLDSLLASGRFKAHERTTLLTEPKCISVYGHKRFPLTTAGEPLKKLSETRFEESAGPSKSKTPSNSVSQRIVIPIPMRPKKPLKKSSKKIDTVRGELKKEYGSYCRSVNESTLKKKSAPHPPESAALATSSLKTNSNHTTSSRRPSVSKLPKPLGPNPVKAKVTRKTRGDLLTADLVGEENIASEEMKMRAAGSTTNLLGYSIPKKPKHADTGVSNDASDSPAGTSAQKRKLSNDEDPESAATVDTSDCPGTSYSFKQPTKRVARGKSGSRENDDNNELASSYSKKPIHKPRDEALPLGRNRRPSSQPFKSSINNYRSVRLGVNGLKDGQQKGPSTSGVSRLEENSENCNQHLSSNDITFPLLSSDQDKLPTLCDSPLVPSTTGTKPGILNLGVRRNGVDKFSVRFADKDEIHEIEARSPRLHTKVPKFSVRPVDVQTLKKDIMLRICNWSYKWIAEQQANKDRDEPPPLLGEVKCENNRVLPKLPTLPVLSVYNSLEAYFAIFHPLMLHEIWANVCKDVELERTVWETLVHITTEPDGGCTILHCESLVSIGTTRLKDWDLVTLSIPIKPSIIIEVFGIVENVEIRKITSTHPPNRRLLEVRKRPENPDWRLRFNLRLKTSNVPTHLDNIFKMTSVTPLRSIIKQFLLHAELNCSPLCEVILRPAELEEVFKLDMIDVEGNEKLNPVQHKAVESITTTIFNTPEDEPKVALLQGPPGTGKSHVIVELVLRMIFMQFEKTGSWPRILICAPSNNAVDEIAIRLCKARDAMKQKFQIVRIGVPSSMHSGVETISLDHLTDKVSDYNVSHRESTESLNLRNLSEELNRLKKMKKNLIISIETANKNGESDSARLHGRKLEGLETQIEGVDRSYKECLNRHKRYFNSNKERENAKNQVIIRANVICTTLNSCRSKEMENLFQMKRGDEHRDRRAKFLCCIIDEASQCTEPESLTPLALGIDKLVMIGDPDQLPATVASQFALKNRFDQSLFNRFYSSRMSATEENTEPVMMLDIQYRMAPSICEWPSKYFYGGKLKTAANLPRTGPCYDYRVLNLLDGREKLDNSTDGRSMMNEGEAALVAKMVDIIISSSSTKEKTIGVITFYQGQRQCILNTLKEMKISREDGRVEVNTVDSFQGREKDIVIVSCVRARGSGGDIGFISSLQRMNVALTRAKESLIVCGHFPTLQVNEAWDDLIKNAHSRGVAHCVTSSYTTTNLKPLLMRPS